MKVQHIIGADLSKESIDLFFHQMQTHLKIENSVKGFRQMLKWLRDQKTHPSQIMIVMEHTGLYSYQMEVFLHEHNICFTKVSALAIKRSLGLVRGKNDKIDAQRIARYGFEKRDMLVATSKPSKVIERLKMLHSTRDRLVKHRASLICAIRQYEDILKTSDLILQSHFGLVKNFDKQIKRIEEEINGLITQEQTVNQNFQLLKTIKAVGEVTATAAIIKTGNFMQFATARKFACYCGVAPFEHSSGKSIRRKTRISHLADKEMKTLLHQSAKCAIQYDKELKSFYERRVAMGKSKKSTINIVRNKILYRMFSVIKRQTPFIENYLGTD
jgi:transposase